jgi:hypothetical protein
MSGSTLPADVAADLEEARLALRALPEGTAPERTDQLYTRWFQAGGIDAPWPDSGSYAATMMMPEAFEAGWTIREVRQDGVLLHDGDNRQDMAAFGDVVPVPTTAPLAAGVPVLRLARRAAAIPGFWHLWSDGWRADPPDRLVRLYLPLAPDAMLLAVEILMKGAPQSERWAAKFLRGRQGGARRDPALLYLPVRGEEAPWVKAVIEAMAPLMIGSRVRLTAPFAGAWLALDPGGERSFGQALCAALAALADEPGVLDDTDVFAGVALGRLRPLLQHLEPAE